MAEQKRWKQRPESSTWGDYGTNDQLGRMNELTPAKVKQGIAEVKEGKTFCLSMPLDYPGGNVLNPAGTGRIQNALVLGIRTTFNF